MYWTIYSKGKGEQASGGVVGDDLSLYKGLWRLTYTFPPVPDIPLIGDIISDRYQRTYKRGEKIFDVEGKECWLREMDIFPRAGIMFCTAEIMQNPVPVLALGIAALGIIGIGLSLILSLDKIEKILELPSIYILLAVVGLFLVLKIVK